MAIAAAAWWLGHDPKGAVALREWWQSWRGDDEELSAFASAPAPATLAEVPPERRDQVSLALRDPAAAFRDFSTWRRRYGAAQSDAERTALVAEGVEAAEARRELLREVIALDPELALRLAVPRRERAGLPLEVVARLEQLVSGKGDFNVLAARPAEAADANFRPIMREAVVNGQRYEAFTYGRRARLASSQNIGLHGVAVDGRLALLDSPIRILEAGETPAAGRVVEEICAISGRPAGPNQSRGDEPVIGADTGERVFYLCSAGHIALLEANYYAQENGGSTATNGAGTPQASAPSAYTTGTKRVLFIRVRFTGDAADSEPQSATSAEAMFNDADAFMRENSFGALSLQPVITPVYTLPQTADWYKNNDTSGYALNILQAARTIAADPGASGLPAFNYTDYDFEVVRYNGGPGTFSGQGYVGTRGCWMKQSSAGILAHELGHNLGLWHANYWEPANPDALTGAGQNREYGDVFDTMGTSSAGALHFNAAEKAALGWLPPETVVTAFVSGTQRVYAHDLGGVLDSSRRYALRVPRGDDRAYWFEFRQNPGWALNPWLQSGLGARWESWSGSNGGTQLLDTTPTSPDGKNDSAIALGRTYADPISGLYVTPLRKNGTVPESLDVDVQIGPFPTNRAPTVQLTAATTQIGVGASLALAAVATDPDGDALAYSWDFGDRTLGDNSANVGHTWTAMGDYRVRVTASDRKGGTASASVLVRVGAVATPRVNGTILDLSGKPVAGVRVATDLGREDLNYHEALTDTDGTYALTGVANGSWSIVATKPGWAFAPVTFFNPLRVAGDTPGMDFVGRTGGWRVTGIVRYADGEPVAGALVSDGTRTEPTDENGAYAFVGVPVGTYTLQVTTPAAQFPSTRVQVAFADTVVPTISEVTYTLSGEVTGTGGALATIGDGWRTATTTTVGSGATARQEFVLTGVPAGTWLLRATAAGETLNPVTFANPVQVTADRTGLVFSGDGASAPAGATIRGRITDSRVGVAGATVTAGAKSASTDSRGGYVLAGLADGTYVVSAAAGGMTFTPANREVAVAGASVEGVDFSVVRNNTPPSFVEAAHATTALNRPFVRLGARATDDGGEAYLRYTWTVVGTAPGSVQFSANGAHGASDTVAQFGAAGSYRLRVTATDALGASASSEVTLIVQAVAVRMAIVPAALAANVGEPVTLAVACTDQFGNTLAPPAEVTWAVNGGGTISRGGVFAPTTPGRGFIASARMGTLSATALIDVGYARGPGYGLTQELWFNVAGTAVRNLTGLAAFPDQPTQSAEREGPLEFKPGEIEQENFGRRLRGFFVPPATGDYVFRIAARDAAELWLSQGSDPGSRALIASTPVATGFRQWTALASQQSAPVRLTKDLPVYIEVLHKVGGDDDSHLSVGVDLPGGLFEGPIPAHRLLPWGARAFGPPRILSPARATPANVGAELVSALDVVATSDGGENTLTYTWGVKGALPGPVVFLPNGTNAAKQTTAHFAQPGRYTIEVTVTDVAQQSVTSSVVVTVASTFATWQRASFSAAELDDPAREATDWGYDADPDHDGLTNLFEYAFGLDPHTADAGAGPRPTFVMVEGARYLAITFRRNTAATDVVFTPQATSDLKNWEVGLVPVGDPNGAEVTYRDFAPAVNFPQRFLRVEVTVP